MPVFPEEIYLPSGAVAELVPDIFFLEFRRTLKRDDQEALLEQFGLQPITKLEKGDSQTPSYPAYQRVNNGSNRVWVRSIESPITDPEYQDKLYQESELNIKVISPAYGFQGEKEARVSYLANTLLIRTADGVSNEEFSEIAAKVSENRDIELAIDKRSRELRKDVYQVYFRPDTGVGAFQLKTEFESFDPIIEVLFESVPIVSPFLLQPNDPLYSSGAGYQGQWNMDIINAGGSGATGWDEQVGDPRISIAIIDSGCDLSHPDLIFVSNGIAFTGNLADVDGGPTNVFSAGEIDLKAHGTRVAGVIGAEMNNQAAGKNVGIAGMAPMCEMIPIAIDGVSANNVSLALSYAANQVSVKVINLSQGFTDKDLPLLTDRILIDNSIEDAVNNKGIVICAAAGNSGTANPANPGNLQISYPARHPLVIAVGASDQADNRVGFSSYLSSIYNSIEQGISVVAPGINIPTTTILGTGDLADLPGNTMDYVANFAGTSAATAHVSGLAALLFSQDDTRTPAEVRRLIEFSADKVGPYTYANDPLYPNSTWNEEMGHGRINVYNALNEIPGAISNTPPTTMSNLCKILCGVGGLLGLISILWHLFGKGPGLEISNIACAENNTKVLVDTVNLTVNCQGDFPCMYEFGNKDSLLAHPRLIDPANDPLYTGYRVATFLESTADCNEPPVIKGLGRGSRTRVYDPFSTNNIQTVDSNELFHLTQSSQQASTNEIFFLFTCADRLYGSIFKDRLTFLDISLFEASYESVLAQHEAFDPSKVSVGPTGSKNTSFTIDNRLHSIVSILKTSNPNYVFRIAYRNEGRFQENIILTGNPGGA